MTERELRRVFEAHQHAVYNFAFRLTGSTALAEDIARIRDSMRRAERRVPT